jgi:hypothetical protein
MTDSKTIDFLRENPDKINWSGFSRNPSEYAIKLLESNQDKIDWSELSFNPSIFQYKSIGIK